MRDIVSCFSENAVSVSHSSISCSTYSNNACISPSSIAPSTQNSISSVYKLVLSTLKQILITVTWCRSHSNQGLTVTFNDEDPAPFRLNTNSRFFRKKKGTKLLELESSSDSSRVEISWDLSSAKYEAGPEPVQGFHLVIVIDSEIGLVLGDTAEEIVSKRFNSKSNTPLAKVTLISRREHCSGSTLYTTKAQFCDTGTWHDVVIRCSTEEENEGLFKSPVLCVCIDKKTVIRVKRLQWNFRGNQTIFVDGLLVDLLWDVHDWFFNPSSSSSSSGGYAVFMFRTRSGMDSRLWLEEKTAQKDKDRVKFSLLIYACKTS
ncbi:kinesin KP [Spatholobus suberectus]|nr:kinesin KP [Spatholobus suberectus]